MFKLFLLIYCVLLKPNQLNLDSIVGWDEREPSPPTVEDFNAAHETSNCMYYPEKKNMPMKENIITTCLLDELNVKYLRQE